jgi:NAD(P)-dependent dehydrogenase (short-subunit alcohol dehydrogenase family)
MSTDFPLINRVALVTGSGRGIGKAIALGMAQAGADVVINFHRNLAPADEVACQIREMGRKALVVKAMSAKWKILTACLNRSIRLLAGWIFLSTMPLQVSIARPCSRSSTVGIGR